MDPLTREELLKLLERCNPRTRKTQIYTVRGKIEDGVASVREELSFIEPDGTVRAVEISELRSCACCGRAIGTDTHVGGVVQSCSSVVCANCFFVCVRCGRSLCRKDATLYGDGDVVCTSCKLVKWLRLFFSLGPIGVKK